MCKFVRLNNRIPTIMPRQECKQSAMGINHVMLRGINKQDFSEDDEEYIQILRILQRSLDHPH